jgi:hypothetical protein
MSRAKLAAIAMIIVFLGVAAFLYAVNALVKGSGPFKLDEASRRITGLPIYHPDPASAYGNLNTTYYDIEADDQLKVETYFLDAEAGVTAQMVTYSLFKGGPPRLKKQVAITWAEQPGYTCETPAMVSNRPPLPESHYQSCLYWMDAERYHHVLFSIWDENQAVALANSLVRVTTRSIER